MKQLWETDKTGLAAMLISEGYQLLELVWRPAPRLPGGYACYFVFAWQSGVEEKAGLFERGTARVEPKKYGEAYGRLRKAMTQTRHEQIQVAG